VSIVATGAIAALFIGFIALSLFRHFGFQALAFGGFGAVMMIVLALGQWRVMKQHKGDRGEQDRRKGSYRARIP
jgi:hypothetical protein